MKRNAGDSAIQFLAKSIFGKLSSKIPPAKVEVKISYPQNSLGINNLMSMSNKESDNTSKMFFCLDFD